MSINNYLHLLFSYINSNSEVNQPNEAQTNSKKVLPNSRWELFAVMLYGLSVGIKTASFFGAVIMIPISQLTVILSSTTPVSYLIRFGKER